VEPEADVRPGRGELSQIVAIAVHFGAFASRKTFVRMTLAKSSVKVESLLRVRRYGAWKFNTPMMIFAKSTPTDGVDGPSGIDVPSCGFVSTCNEGNRPR
jgi:hypothetical protein